MSEKNFHHHEKLVETPEDVLALADKLSALPAEGEDLPMIAIDTEFIRERTFFPIVALIQIATRAESWLVDPLALKNEELKPLLDVFAGEKTLKILHAAQADQECLYSSFGMTARPSFDTAAGASLCGFGEAPGLAKLTKELLGISLAKGHARTDWTVRPLPAQLSKYAHQDVEYLIPLAEKLFARLDSRGRKRWGFELSAKYEDGRVFEPAPEEMARKIVRNRQTDRRGYATLVALVRWRERRVRELDIPRKWVADDDLIAALANVRPSDLAHLSAFRGLNKGELKHSGQAILDAIHAAAKIPERELPPVPSIETALPDEGRALEVLMCFLRVLADRHEIAPKFLLSQEQALGLLRERFETPADFVKKGILAQGACDLIGDELLRMLRGDSALAIKGSDVVVASLAHS
ncbi:MAG: HRDC domain-containing protein [Deltaproteobacteria bacterium]|nr:HRDC domain-containing protein [Deltaproteobacteria bacterium]